jgi:putative sterol carrier protein
MAEREAPAPDLGAMGDADAAQLAAMVGQIPEEQLAEGMAHPEGRQMILDEIFNRMSEHAEPEKIGDVDAVVHFQITERHDGGSDLYEAVIRSGEVKVNKEATEEPKVTITTGPVHFVKLVTGQQSGPVMFMTGKLKLDGDVMFASRMTSFFRSPTAAA